MNLELFKKSFIAFWKTKPFWCQPWSILLTGISLIILAYIFFKNIILLFSISLLILIWWILFLLVAPLSLIENSNSLLDDPNNQK